MATPSRIPRPATLIPTIFAIVLASGWASRESAFARERAEALKSQTVTVDQVKLGGHKDKGEVVGQAGLYFSGDTPGSTSFVTGRFVLDPGKTPHDPHRHVEEEVMIVESGEGEIFCDGKINKVGPGSAMYTTPNAPHGIVNTGKTPLVFYFIKWAGKPAGGS